MDHHPNTQRKRDFNIAKSLKVFRTAAGPCFPKQLPPNVHVQCQFCSYKFIRVPGNFITEEIETITRCDNDAEIAWGTPENQRFYCIQCAKKIIKRSNATGTAMRMLIKIEARLKAYKSALETIGKLARIS